MPITINQETGKRFNPHAVSAERPFKGYARLDTPQLRTECGIIEIDDDPVSEEYLQHPDWYSVSEDWEATQRPYTIYTRKKASEIRKLELSKLVSAYQQDITSFVNAWALASVSDGDNVATRTAEVVQEMKDRKAKHTKDVAALSLIK